MNSTKNRCNWTNPLSLTLLFNVAYYWPNSKECHTAFFTHQGRMITRLSSAKKPFKKNFLIFSVFFGSKKNLLSNMHRANMIRKRYIAWRLWKELSNSVYDFEVHSHMYITFDASRQYEILNSIETCFMVILSKWVFAFWRLTSNSSYN